MASKDMSRSLEDIAKITISQIVAQIDEEPHQEVSPAGCEASKEEGALAVKEEAREDNSIQSEVIFLRQVKERAEVLFEGLHSGGENMDLRLDITIKFLEFLLATIEHRLDNLPK